MSSLDKSSILNSLSVIVERVQQRNRREIKCVTYGNILVKSYLVTNIWALLKSHTTIDKKYKLIPE